MLNQKDHYVSWALLIIELDDAREHLEDLIEEMTNDGSIDEEEYRVQIGGIFAHLNRAWHGRDDPQYAKISQDEFSRRSRFPTDLVTCG